MIISIPKIIFEYEHYEYKSQIVHTNEGLHVNVWDKTLNFFHFGGVESDIKLYGFPCFIPHITFWVIPLKALTCHLSLF